MAMINSIELKKEEALALLDYIKKNEHFVDCGTGRGVFCLIRKGGTKYAVKIAADDSGRRQNAIELDLWNSTNSFALNPIVWNYEDIILICDWVEPLNLDIVEAAYERSFEDYRELVEEWYEEDESLSKEDFYRYIRNVVAEITLFQGDSYDNYQLGFNAENELVAYDYGYSTDYCSHDLIGKAEEYCQKIDGVRPIFNAVKEYIETGEQLSPEEAEYAYPCKTIKNLSMQDCFRICKGLEYCENCPIFELCLRVNIPGLKASYENDETIVEVK